MWWSLLDWSLQFGLPRTLKDKNAMNCSALFQDMCAGRWFLFHPKVWAELSYTGMVYWLADGLYPNFRIPLTRIDNPTFLIENFIAKSHEAFQNGAKHVYAVLFSLWHILVSSSRIWPTADLRLIVKESEILNVMTVESTDKDHDDAFGTKNIANIDVDAAIVPIRSQSNPVNAFAQAEYCFATADRVEKRILPIASKRSGQCHLGWSRYTCAVVPFEVALNWNTQDDERIDGLHDKIGGESD